MQKQPESPDAMQSFINCWVRVGRIEAKQEALQRDIDELKDHAAGVVSGIPNKLLDQQKENTNESSRHIREL